MTTNLLVSLLFGDDVPADLQARVRHKIGKCLETLPPGICGQMHWRTVSELQREVNDGLETKGKESNDELGTKDSSGDLAPL